MIAIWLFEVEELDAAVEIVVVEADYEHAGKVADAEPHEQLGGVEHVQPLYLIGQVLRMMLQIRMNMIVAPTDSWMRRNSMIMLCA